MAHRFVGEEPPATIHDLNAAQATTHDTGRASNVPQKDMIDGGRALWLSAW